MTDLIQQGRDLVAAADDAYLDRLAAHDCGAAAAARIAIEALRATLEALDARPDISPSEALIYETESYLVLPDADSIVYEKVEQKMQAHAAKASGT